MVASRLDADHHQLGAEPRPGGGDQPLQPGQPGPVGGQPDTVDHDLPEQRAGNHKPRRLGDIDPDQQDPLRINPAHQLQKRPCPLAPDVGTVHHRPTPFCRPLSVTDSSLAGRGSFMSRGISADLDRPAPPQRQRPAALIRDPHGLDHVRFQVESYQQLELITYGSGPASDGGGRPGEPSEPT